MADDPHDEYGDRRRYDRVIEDALKEIREELRSARREAADAHKEHRDKAGSLSTQLEVLAAQTATNNGNHERAITALENKVQGFENRLMSEEMVDWFQQFYARRGSTLERWIANGASLGAIVIAIIALMSATGHLP